MDELERRVYTETGMEEWEIEMIERALTKVRLSERSELRSELIEKVFVAKRRRGIRNWRHYLVILLRNDRVSRFRKRKTQVEIVESKSESECYLLRPIILPFVEDLDNNTALAEACKELRPDQWELLWVLDQCDLNQVLAAKLLGIHRNTLRNRLRKIREIFIRHGFQIYF